MTELRVCKHCIEILKKERYVSGSVNIYQVRFEFVNEWDDLTKIVVFKVGQKTREIILSEDHICTIPWEVLINPSTRLQIGIYGIRESEIARPTVMVNLGPIEKGAKTKNVEGIPPIFDIYQQILSALSTIPRPMTEDELYKILMEDGAVDVATDESFINGSRVSELWAAVNHAIANAEVGGLPYGIGYGLKIVNNNLEVNTVSDFKGDNTLPMTAVGVQSTIGNIEALLGTI